MQATDPETGLTPIESSGYFLATCRPEFLGDDALARMHPLKHALHDGIDWEGVANDVHAGKVAVFSAESGEAEVLKTCALYELAGADLVYCHDVRRGMLYVMRQPAPAAQITLSDMDIAGLAAGSGLTEGDGADAHGTEADADDADTNDADADTDGGA